MLWQRVIPDVKLQVPTQNLVHTKDEEGMVKGRPKRTIVKPIRYRDVNSINNIMYV